MRTIALTNGGEAIVDDHDYEWLSEFSWRRQAQVWSKKEYVYRQFKTTEGKHRRTFMHRDILKAKNGQMIDHRNRNGLDNRRENLRFCDRSMNSFNSDFRKGLSGYRGVSYIRGSKKPWKATIMVNKKHIHLGWFDDRIDAAKAYDVAARQYAGEFARLNFPL